jgi:hypothetical protein
MAGWLLHCGDAAYPFYHDNAPARPGDDPPEWLARGLLGPHIPRLKALWQEHGNEIRFVTAHDDYGLAVNQAQNAPEKRL